MKKGCFICLNSDPFSRLAISVYPLPVALVSIGVEEPVSGIADTGENVSLSVKRKYLVRKVK